MKALILSALATVAIVALALAQANTLSITDTATWTSPGVTLTLNKSVTLRPAGSNLTYQTLSVGTDIVEVSTDPVKDNGPLYIINNAATGTYNYVEWGNNGTNFPNRANGGEIGHSRFVLDGTEKLYLRAGTNTLSIAIGWAPN